MHYNVFPFIRNFKHWIIHPLKNIKGRKLQYSHLQNLVLLLKQQIPGNHQGHKLSSDWYTLSLLKDALFMIFLKSFHYQNLEWHEFMPDDLKLHENQEYMSWICFRGDKIRAHNIPKYYSKPNTLRKTKQCCLCKWTLTTAIFVHEKSRALQNTITTL